MNAFFLRSFNEYKRHNEMKKSFVLQTERINAALRAADGAKDADDDSFDAADFHRRSLLLLMPLVEVAWADGRVTRREMEAIVQTADAYGLIEDPEGYRELIGRLLTRPAPSVVGRQWQNFRRLFEALPEAEREAVRFGLLFQARFVAEQSADSLIAFLSGERVGRDEQEALRAVAEQMENAEASVRRMTAEKETDAAAAVAVAALAAGQSAAAVPAATAAVANHSDSNDLNELIPLVPLVKTAWAEGRVTKRERHIVFEAAARGGVKPGSPAHRRLSEWLELHPTDEFYDSALNDLTSRWQNFAAEEKDRLRFNLLNDCTRVAEASGGSKNYPAGGPKICDEEIAAVKRIAKKLNAAAASRSV